MTKKTQTAFDRCKRVLAFLKDNDALWGADDPVRTELTSLEGVSANLAELSTEHLVLQQQVRKSTATQNAALRKLRPRARNIIRMADTFENEAFGFQGLEYYSRYRRIAEWIDVSRSLAETFRDRVDDLVAQGAKPDVIEGLETSLAAVIEAAAKRDDDRMQRLRVTRELNAKAASARKLFKKLNAAMQLRFEEDPTHMSQWQRANRDHDLYPTAAPTPEVQEVPSPQPEPATATD